MLTRARRGNTSFKNARANGAIPTLEELRQLIQLRREINDLYTHNNDQPSVETSQQQ
jgi:hypothetical protein